MKRFGLLVKKGNISCQMPRTHYFQKRRTKPCTIFLFDNAILLCDGVGDDLQYWTMFEVHLYSGIMIY